MNRRQFLGSVAGATASGVVLADCRDDNGMIGPDGDSINCIDLSFRRAFMVRDGPSAARAEFHFGAYEDLLKHQKARLQYTFEFEHNEYRIRVTRLSVDVNRAVGCVTCVVEGSLYAS